MATQIQLRRDTAANWATINPTLAQGEIGLETNTAKIKIGTGSTAWNSLAYASDVTLAANNAFTGANIFTNSTGQTFRQAATQDGILLRGRAGGTTSLNVELVPGTLTASRTLTAPDTNGTIITSGDTGTVTSTMIADGTILNADVNASAAIAGTKISPDFGSQNVTTTGNITANAQGDVRFGDADSSNWVAFQAPATVTSNVTWTLPAADGTANQVLSTNGSGTLSWSTAGGLTHFVETENTTSPNNISPVDAFVATDAAYSIIDVALVSKGGGATLAQIPDNAGTGGNKRGGNATDWQKSRVFASAVASGDTATVSGGNGNTASGSYSTVSGGSNCTGSGNYSSVSGGNSNVASGTNATAGGGASNTASGTSTTTIGGSNNTASGDYSTAVGGNYGTTRSIVGYLVAPASNSPISSAAGVTQSGRLLLGRQTTDATATVLTSNTSAASTNNQVILPNNSAYSFSGEVIAGVTGAGNTSRWTINGAIKRGANAASTAMVGTATVTKTHNDAGAAGWTVAVTADTTNGGIKVEVTGQASTTIRWVCKIDTTEMSF